MTFSSFCLRGGGKLELRFPHRVHGIAFEPEPNWSFESLWSELDSLEEKLSSSANFPAPFAKNQSRGCPHGEKAKRLPAAFSMRVSDEELEVSDGEEDDSRGLVAAKRINFDDANAGENEDSGQEFGALDVQPYLMDEVGLVEAALFELFDQHQLELKVEIRRQISALEMELMRKYQKDASAFARIDKYSEARRDTDWKLDTLYQRNIAEALDDHLTSIQRDHEIKSQMEERRIRIDLEEAKRKEKAVQEERLRQERAREEAHAKRRAEEARIAALEAEKKEKEEAGKIEDSRTVISPVQTNATAGDIVRASASALSLEQARLQKLRELENQNQSLMSMSNMNLDKHTPPIGRLIRQIRGIEENVRTKASELLKIFKNPECPESITVAAFAKKVVEHCENPDNAAFASAQVIVLISSQVPYAMDLILADFHKACIYTVPKHIAYSKAAFSSKEAYYKEQLGFKEDGGQLESVKDYLRRMEAYMRLYGALVQTETVRGIENSHGPAAGWLWLARFLNALPANAFTAVALNAFLQPAGFVLYRKYKSQFRKLLHMVSSHFLNALKTRDDPDLRLIIMEIESYIQDRRYLQEPEGRRMEGKPLLSSQIASEQDYNGYNYYYSR
ncbi:unnamed protein product [Linum tenue]|uniref:mRNA export factor GLE1 n=2 Tax=Linum tenue TaxID=586396 RepID=A0AAV0I8T6_9ROSI|nr:unnamed protein product [Linum tenue]